MIQFDVRIFFKWVGSTTSQALTKTLTGEELRVLDLGCGFLSMLPVLLTHIPEGSKKCEKGRGATVGRKIPMKGAPVLS